MPTSSFYALILGLLFLDNEVMTQIENLGHNKFMARQKATQELMRMEERAIPLLRLAGTTSSDLEIKTRSERIIEAYFSVKPSNYPYIPYIDMITPGLVDQGKYLAKAREVGCNGSTNYAPPFDACWPEWRLATTIFVREKMESGEWKRADAIKFLDSLVPTEKAYLKKLEDQHKQRQSNDNP
jgi:hypothetical protein